MDLDKLARLSCLEIKGTDRAYFENSLTAVVGIMEAITGLEAQSTNDTVAQTIVFDSLCDGAAVVDASQLGSVMLDRDEHYPGIHLEQGVFLAPKVIKKD